ncbi:unnamed protein product, partial [Ectocarpus sp. 8 AP-2014]
MRGVPCRILLYRLGNTSHLSLVLIVKPFRAFPALANSHGNTRDVPTREPPLEYPTERKAILLGPTPKKLAHGVMSSSRTGASRALYNIIRLSDLMAASRYLSKPDTREQDTSVVHTVKAATRQRRGA